RRDRLRLREAAAETVQTEGMQTTNSPRHEHKHVLRLRRCINSAIFPDASLRFQLLAMGRGQQVGWYAGKSPQAFLHVLDMRQLPSDDCGTDWIQSHHHLAVRHRWGEAV